MELCDGYPLWVPCPYTAGAFANMSLLFALVAANLQRCLTLAQSTLI